MSMLVNKRPYIFCVNGVETWVLEGKKVHFCKLGYRIPFKATYGEIKNIIRVKFSFKSEYVDLWWAISPPKNLYYQLKEIFWICVQSQPVFLANTLNPDQV